MSMVMIGAKVPPSWKELIEKLAREKGLDQSEVIREVLRVGLKHMKEINKNLSDLAEEGEIILKSKRAFALRRAVGHWVGHQSGWRATAERIEDPIAQKTYLDISEQMKNQFLDYLKKQSKKRRTLLEYMWDTECQGCSYRLLRDKEFCTKNCKRYKERRSWFSHAKPR